MDRGIIMTPRPHLDKLAVLTALIAAYTGETLQMMGFSVVLLKKS